MRAVKKAEEEEAKRKNDELGTIRPAKWRRRSKMNGSGRVLFFSLFSKTLQRRLVRDESLGFFFSGSCLVAEEGGLVSI